jgi:hypothetical protein
LDILKQSPEIYRKFERFEFIGQFFFQNDVFKLQEVFSELGIGVFLGNGSFHTILILHI